MRYFILMGSPRKNGNTATLLNPFIEECQNLRIDCRTTWLYDKKIEPCIACCKCQYIIDSFGCPFNDDVQEIFDRIMESDMIVLATPIYSWYCTAPMKSLLDRLVYGMNKYYGNERGPSFWAQKKLAIIATCGYRPEQGADLFEEGIKRYCKHSQLIYTGMLVERDPGYKSVFSTPVKIENARKFARELFKCF